MCCWHPCVSVHLLLCPIPPCRDTHGGSSEEQCGQCISHCLHRPQLLGCFLPLVDNVEVSRLASEMHTYIYCILDTHIHSNTVSLCWLCIVSAQQHSSLTLGGWYVCH